MARQGEARQVRSGMARWGKARSGEARQVWKPGRVLFLPWFFKVL